MSKEKFENGLKWLDIGMTMMMNMIVMMMMTINQIESPYDSFDCLFL